MKAGPRGEGAAGSWVGNPGVQASRPCLARHAGVRAGGGLGGWEENPGVLAWAQAVIDRPILSSQQAPDRPDRGNVAQLTDPTMTPLPQFISWLLSAWQHSP